MSLFQELKRRNVFRVAVAYLVTAWVLLQVADLVLQNIHAPDWVIQVFMLALALGFPVALIFAWAFELTPEGLKKEKDVDRTHSITHRTGRKLDFAIIGVLAVAVVLLLVDRFSDEVPETGSEPRSQADPAGGKSIAVLPFVNMSSDPEQEFFSDGISEEILNALAKVKELQVSGRTSSFAFKGDNQDLRLIGETLGVEHILEGSVRKAGDRIRITAQLIRVDNGFHLWSESYDRQLTDVFAIQDEIAQAILTQLKATLLGDEQITATPTQTAAYESYLLARQRMYERTEGSLQKAIELLDEAISVDPAYAPAYAQRAIATFLLSDRMYGRIPEAEARTQGKLFVDRALDLDARHPEALAAKGYYLTEFNLGKAEGIELFRQALEINPNLTDASLWLGMELRTHGWMQEAIQILESAYARDPLHRRISSNLAISYIINGLNDKARAVIERMKVDNSDDPESSSLEAWLAWLQGDVATSIRMNEIAFKSMPSNAAYKRTLGFDRLDLFEPERALEIDLPEVRILALQRLGRTEEATILGFEQTAAGRVLPQFFQVLVENGEYEKLIDFVESRWPDLDDFEAIYPDRGGEGSFLLAFIAQSYGHLGKEPQFNDAMGRFKAALDQQVGQGADNANVHFSQAIYTVLAGDNEKAISLLEDVFTHSSGFSINDPKAWPVFAPLNGDPRYEQAKAGLMEHINAERQKLGWEPVSI